MAEIEKALILVSSPYPCPVGLQNDHKAVMAKIEKALYKKHAEDRLAREAREGDTAGKGSQDLSSRHPAKGFAKVNSVEQHSPAEQAVSNNCSKKTLRPLASISSPH